MNKLTDNEIVKAIEKCASIGESCEDCPFYEYTDCDKRLKECFHDMLNRQKAEVERLKEELDGETVKNMRLGHKIERLKAESQMEYGYADALE